MVDGLYGLDMDYDCILDIVLEAVIELYYYYGVFRMKRKVCEGEMRGVCESVLSWKQRMVCTSNRLEIVMKRSGLKGVILSECEIRRLNRCMKRRLYIRGMSLGKRRMR